MVTQNTRTFPATPQTMAMELYANNAWTDVTNDVRWADGVSISSGRPNEASLLTPSSCGFILKNISGNYSPRNPLGAYYGSIGRNTPMRLSLVCAQDTFARTVLNGWGSSVDGWVWTTSGGSASDFNVSGTTATMAHTARNTSHFAGLQALPLETTDVTFQVSTNVATITGSSLYAGARLKSDGTHFYLFTLIMPAGATPQLYISQADGTQLVSPTTISRLTYAANTAISVRFQVEGQIFRAKAWMTATQSEPQGWDIVSSEDLSTELNNLQTGYVQLYSSVDPSNTNTLPITFTFANVVIRAPRFAGEVSEWPQTWDTTMGYATVAPVASGPLRRLSAGGGPLDSAARRYISAQSPYAYWPLEDGAAAINGVNYANGGPPMQAIQGTNNGVGTVKWAQDTTLLGGGPAPVLSQGSQLYAWIDPSAIQSATAWTVAFGAKINRNSSTTIILSANGPFSLSVNLFTDGSATVYLTQSTGSTLMATAPALGADAIDGVWHAYAVTIGTSGVANVIFARDGIEYVGSTALGPLGFFAVAQLVFPTPATSDQFAYSHVAVWGSDTQTAGRQAVAKAMFGWQQETVLNRLIRLCAEENIEFGYNNSTDFNNTAAMGPQRQQTLVQLLQECVNTDCGELTESRGSFGFHYHTHMALENRAAMLTLSLSGQQVGPPFSPSDDDQNTRNSVTVTAPNGASFRYQLTTGRMSIAAPPAGAGEYDSSWSANAFLYNVIRNIAGWRVGLGTVDKPRYPLLRVNRATGAVVASGWSGAFGAAIRVSLMDKVVVTGMTPSGLYDDAELTVIGMTELLHTMRHELAYICIPEEPKHTGVVANAASPAATDSRLDTNGSSLHTGVSSSATSLSVDTAAGNQLWTTVAGDFPFDVIMGGERMTVSTITGAASPQTFIVTRSVNGVVKAQTAGTDVRLFHPNYVAL